MMNVGGDLNDTCNSNLRVNIKMVFMWSRHFYNENNFSRSVYINKGDGGNIVMNRNGLIATGSE